MSKQLGSEWPGTDGGRGECVHVHWYNMNINRVDLERLLPVTALLGPLESRRRCKEHWGDRKRESIMILPTMALNLDHFFRSAFQNP